MIHFFKLPPSDGRDPLGTEKKGGLNTSNEVVVNQLKCEDQKDLALQMKK